MIIQFSLLSMFGLGYEVIGKGYRKLNWVTKCFRNYVETPQDGVKKNGTTTVEERTEIQVDRQAKIPNQMLRIEVGNQMPDYMMETDT